MAKFYDTNALLELGDKVFEEPFYISSKSLEEIELIKVSFNKDSDVKYKARHIARSLLDNNDKFITIVMDATIRNILNVYGLPETPDNLIIACAVKARDDNKDLVFVSYDINCAIIAEKIFKLNVESCMGNCDILYKGYKTIKGNTEQINHCMENIDFSRWSVNEYLIIENTDDNTSKEMRFDGEKFINLKLPPSKFIKAKNSLQRCALDIMMNPDITISAILGGYGSGKTHISMQMALYNVTEKGNQSKILGVREPHGEGKEIGFLPGDFSDKTENFFLPIAQQLNGGEFELEGLKQRGVLESNIPYYLKGTTYHNTIILVDEAEDLSEKQIRLIGTRLGENSKIYFAGDYKQSVVNTTTENPLVKMCNEFKGNPKFGCIYLGEDVRSETSKMFANLFN